MPQILVSKADSVVIRIENPLHDLPFLTLKATAKKSFVHFGNTEKGPEAYLNPVLRSATSGIH